MQVRKNKIGRNDPCWCGSGVKYKRCHLNRDKGRPVPLYEVSKVHRRSFKHRKCMHPDAPTGCIGQPIQAHTVQKRGCLDQIAKDGHVYQVKIPPQDLMETGKIRPRLIGISDASTFTGFCKHHDQSTFIPIERKSFKTTDQQCALYAYRAVCFEMHRKIGMQRQLGDLRDLDRGQPLHRQIQHQTMLQGMKIGADAAVSDLEMTKLALEKALKSGLYTEYCYYVLHLDSIPELMCSGVFNPFIDFNNKQLQDLSDVNSYHERITLSVVATEGSGAVILSWIHNESMASERFIQSFDSIPDKEKGNAIVRLAFDMIENIYLSPKWWDALDADNKELLEGRILAGIGPGAPSNTLIEDGCNAVQWKIVGKKIK